MLGRLRINPFLEKKTKLKLPPEGLLPQPQVQLLGPYDKLPLHGKPGSPPSTPSSTKPASKGGSGADASAPDIARRGRSATAKDEMAATEGWNTPTKDRPERSRTRHPTPDSHAPRPLVLGAEGGSNGKTPAKEQSSTHGHSHSDSHGHHHSNSHSHHEPPTLLSKTMSRLRVSLLMMLVFDERAKIGATDGVANNTDAAKETVNGGIVRRRVMGCLKRCFVCCWARKRGEGVMCLICRRTTCIITWSFGFFIFCGCMFLCRLVVGDRGLDCPIPPSLLSTTGVPTTGVPHLEPTAHHLRCWSRSGNQTGCPATPLGSIRFKGYHNSYHIQPRGQFLLWGFNRLIRVWQYSHPSLSAQLSAGARQFELDIHFGADRRTLVYHFQGLDGMTVCRCLSSCLAEIRAWSDAHPRHLPVVVLLDVKCCHWFEDFRSYLNGINRADFDALDATIRTVWADAPGRLFTPDDLRGTYHSLARAVVECGWPDAETMRGKTIFALLKVEGYSMNRHFKNLTQASSYAQDDDEEERLFNPRSDAVCAAQEEQSAQQCEADGRWYDCNCEACSLEQLCASDTGLRTCACPLLKNASQNVVPRRALLGRAMFTMGTDPFMSLADAATQRHVGIIKADLPSETDRLAVQRGFLLRNRGSVVVGPSTRPTESAARLQAVLDSGAQLVALDHNDGAGTIEEQWGTWFAGRCTPFDANRTVQPPGASSRAGSACFCNDQALVE